MASQEHKGPFQQFQNGNALHASTRVAHSRQQRENGNTNDFQFGSNPSTAREREVNTNMGTSGVGIFAITHNLCHGENTTQQRSPSSKKPHNMHQEQSSKRPVLTSLDDCSSIQNMRHLLHPDPIQAAETLTALLEKEAVYARGDYLASFTPRDHGPRVSANDRLMLVDWMYSVADQCEFKRETTAVAMELVDRFLSSCPPKASHFYLAHRENFQLLAVAAFYVSVKTMESVAFGSDLLVLASNGTYTKEEIERTEKELLHGLGWKVNPPTAMQFAFLIMSIVTPHTAMHDELVMRVLDETAYQVESSVRDINLSRGRSSSIAVAAMFNVAYQLLDSGIRQEFLLALSCILVGKFAHPKELQVTRLRLQSVLDSHETTNDDTTHLPNEGESAASQVVAVLEVSAVRRALDGCGPTTKDAQHCTVFTSSQEEQTFRDTRSLNDKMQDVRRISITGVNQLVMDATRNETEWMPIASNITKPQSHELAQKFVGPQRSFVGRPTNAHWDHFDLTRPVTPHSSDG
ncbi:hypothetical protein THAOC_35351 [Thalassiosira oceanica]|uniref:Cyclin-like domain-containing protein n=1 Tax=Thalassiosira oceanica TaxID=159749 RepID=K0RAD1_THAOC|nr:hypothetical protein THAOC_35351 [Thalassiosira oceanica]|eukprot:EJK46006.1 hypothetical protein THAOC_35351 [Thalassiosira oceanica]